MRCLVTGGRGFIGSNLVDLLLSKGHDVVILDDLSGIRPSDLPQGCEFINGNIVNRGDVDLAINRCRVVFHLAASVGNARSIAEPVRDATINVLGTINVLEASLQARVDRVVYSSSAGIFGNTGSYPVWEEYPRGPDSPYGCTKLCAENLCLTYAKLYGIGAVCLRYFNVYGPGQRYSDYGNVVPIFAERTLEGLPITIYGDGEQTRDFVHVKDVAAANLLSATVAGASGTYNIGSGTVTSINRLAEIMKVIGVVHKDPRPGDVDHSTADITKARSDLGYSPTQDLVRGIEGYLDWFKRDKKTT